MAKDEINAFLGAGTSYTGRLNFQGAVRIDGNFQGEIESDGTLVVGREANIEGEIQVGRVISSGRICGNLTARDKVVLHKAARFEGRLRTPLLMVEEGAVLEGDVSMAVVEEGATLVGHAGEIPENNGAGDRVLGAVFDPHT